MMKIAGYIIAVIFALWSILTIVYMWNNDFISFSNYIKTTITSAILIIAIGVVAVIFKETKKESDYKKDDYLD